MRIGTARVDGSRVVRGGGGWSELQNFIVCRALLWYSTITSHRTTRDDALSCRNPVF